MKKMKRERETGCESWGGYMDAKRSKLIQQFNEETVKVGKHTSDLFKGVAIFVNGYTVPSSDELRRLMMQHGGSYHHYHKTGSTTHIIASNLPNSKLKLTQNHKIVKPSWIIESIKANKVLNYCDYLLFPNQKDGKSSIKNLFQEKNEHITKKTNMKDASEEGFLTEFYNNSRLHHISTMSTMFKDHINDIRSNKSHKLTGRDELLKNYPYKQNIVPNFLDKEKKYIMHIDMDCFFVSVGLRNKPELCGLPVVVTHSNGNQVRAREGVNIQNEFTAYRRKRENADKLPREKNESQNSNNKSTMDELDSMAEIASCSYEARKAGIKNGMFVGQALKLCPDLHFIHYDFESYKEVSFTLYNTVARYTVDIEAVSCDELYADCTELLQSLSMDPMDFANVLRVEIKEKTKCPCSAGFGGNKLQARLATKKAKPNGQFYLKEEHVTSFLYSLPVSELPGVGGSTTYKLKCMGIKTCGDLQNVSVSKLQEELGKKLGETLQKNSFGRDDKPLVYNHIRKSVSADINYGIRFNNDDERDSFLEKLSEEVSNRLTSAKMKGRSITLKLMIRSKDAPEETAKYMGHGVCDQISKGITLPSSVSSSSIILRETVKIMNSLNINCKNLRGIGIQISRLESELPNDNKLMRFLKSKKENRLEKLKVVKSIKQPHAKAMKTYEEMSLSEIDQSFLNAMPHDIQREIISTFKNKTTSNLKEKEAIKTPKYEVDSKNNQSVEVKEEQNNVNEMKTYIAPADLRDLIKQWVETEEVPQNRDISMITQYLIHLIQAERLEDLLIIIKSFFRYISRFKKSNNWKAAYRKIIDDVQSCINKKYNSKLLIEDTFCFS